ncbi:SRPBCC family protein [Streptacidiphilus fuscans]|uniref:SRPBCC family protein n=1 Tax=Streptacidiphilus fuscans TaxID=2789292 RepID=A0A931B4G5_9ACTN|nr:SRPBCC family protein [Streptacidiphilus fuscans]MBF9069187.1 SRPBCC family protein [Streptacidiphilus fuscans]
MRYADGLGVECEVEVDAALSRVWELVTDIGLPARFSPELQRVAWLDGADRPQVGARFQGWNENARLGAWSTVSHVVELAEHRVFAWVVTDAEGRFGGPTRDPANAMASWRYELSAASDGSTLLRQSALIGPGRNGVTLAIERMPEREEQIIAFRLADLRSGMETTLRGIKSLAEEAEHG